MSIALAKLSSHMLLPIPDSLAGPCAVGFLSSQPHLKMAGLAQVFYGTVRKILLWGQWFLDSPWSVCSKYSEEGNVGNSASLSSSAQTQLGTAVMSIILRKPQARLGLAEVSKSKPLT